MADQHPNSPNSPSDGSQYAHAFYVYPEKTDEADAEVLQFREGLRMDTDFEMAGFEDNPNDYLWQKRTYILSSAGGPATHPEWYRTHKSVEQVVISPKQTFMRPHPEGEQHIDDENMLSDGSVTEITQYKDLMCKKGLQTDVYIVSKSYPSLGYSYVQNFRKVQDTSMGLDTYIRGECVEYKTKEEPVHIDPSNRVTTLEDILASFHIQRRLTSKILYLTKPLQKRDDLKKTPPLKSPLWRSPLPPETPVRRYSSPPGSPTKTNGSANNPTWDDKENRNEFDWNNASTPRSYNGKRGSPPRSPTWRRSPTSRRKHSNELNGRHEERPVFAEEKSSDELSEPVKPKKRRVVSVLGVDIKSHLEAQVIPVKIDTMEESSPIRQHSTADRTDGRPRRSGEFRYNDSEMRLTDDDLELNRGKLIATLDQLNTEWKVTFDFMATSFKNPMRNILHMQAKDSKNGREGYCIPQINACPTPHLGSIHISTTINQRVSHYSNNIIKFKLGEWNTIMVAQEKVGRDYQYMIFINGLRVHCTANRHPKVFKNVLVYASNPYFDGQEGFIRNLVVHGAEVNIPLAPEIDTTQYEEEEETARKLSQSSRVSFSVRQGKPDANKSSVLDDSFLERTSIPILTIKPKEPSTKIFITPKEEYREINEHDLTLESLNQSTLMDMSVGESFYMPPTPSISIEPESRKIYIPSSPSVPENENNTSHYSVRTLSQGSSNEKIAQCQERGVSLVQFVSETKEPSRPSTPDEEKYVFVEPRVTNDVSDTASPPLKRKYEGSSEGGASERDANSFKLRMSPVKKDSYPFDDPETISTSDVTFDSSHDELTEEYEDITVLTETVLEGINYLNEEIEILQGEVKNTINGHQGMDTKPKPKPKPNAHVFEIEYIERDIPSSDDEEHTSESVLEKTYTSHNSHISSITPSKQSPVATLPPVIVNINSLPSPARKQKEEELVKQLVIHECFIPCDDKNEEESEEEESMEGSSEEVSDDGGEFEIVDAKTPGWQIQADESSSEESFIVVEHVVHSESDSDADLEIKVKDQIRDGYAAPAQILEEIITPVVQGLDETIPDDVIGACAMDTTDVTKEIEILSRHSNRHSSEIEFIVDSTDRRRRPRSSGIELMVDVADLEVRNISVHNIEKTSKTSVADIHIESEEMDIGSVSLLQDVADGADTEITIEVTQEESEEEAIIPVINEEVLAALEGRLSSEEVSEGSVRNKVSSQLCVYQDIDSDCTSEITTDEELIRGEEEETDSLSLSSDTEQNVHVTIAEVPTMECLHDLMAAPVTLGTESIQTYAIELKCDDEKRIDNVIRLEDLHAEFLPGDIIRPALPMVKDGDASDHSLTVESDEDDVFDDTIDAQINGGGHLASTFIMDEEEAQSIKSDEEFEVPNSSGGLMSISSSEDSTLFLDNSLMYTFETTADSGATTDITTLEDYSVINVTKIPSPKNENEPMNSSFESFLQLMNQESDEEEKEKRELGKKRSEFKAFIRRSFDGTLDEPETNEHPDGFSDSTSISSDTSDSQLQPTSYSIEIKRSTSVKQEARGDEGDETDTESMPEDEEAVISTIEDKEMFVPTIEDEEMVVPKIVQEVELQPDFADDVMLPYLSPSVQTPEDIINANPLLAEVLPSEAPCKDDSSEDESLPELPTVSCVIDKPEDILAAKPLVAEVLPSEVLCTDDSSEDEYLPELPTLSCVIDKPEDILAANPLVAEVLPSEAPCKDESSEDESLPELPTVSCVIDKPEDILAANSLVAEVLPSEVPCKDDSSEDESLPELPTVSCVIDKPEDILAANPLVAEILPSEAPYKSKPNSSDDEALAVELPKVSILIDESKYIIAANLPDSSEDESFPELPTVSCVIDKPEDVLAANPLVAEVLPSELPCKAEPDSSDDEALAVELPKISILIDESKDIIAANLPDSSEDESLPELPTVSCVIDKPEDILAANPLLAEILPSEAPCKEDFSDDESFSELPIESPIIDTSEDILAANPLVAEILPSEAPCKDEPDSSDDETLAVELPAESPVIDKPEDILAANPLVAEVLPLEAPCKEEELEAAYLIQKTFKGYQTRKAFFKKKFSALTIQRAFRSHRHDNATKQTNAAIKIQATWKRYKQKQNYTQIQISTVKLQSFARMAIQKSRFEEERRAAGVIQLHLRSFLSMRKDREEYLVVRRSVRIIQSTIRMWLVNVRLRKMNHSATKIQALFRGHSSRKEYYVRQQYVIISQTLVKNSVENAIRDLRHQYNTVSQELVRSSIVKATERLQCQQYDELSQGMVKAAIDAAIAELQYSSAVVIQSACRQYLTRCDYLKKKSAATKIQASFKGYKTRKDFKTNQNIWNMCQKLVDHCIGEAYSRYSDLQTTSAITIQTCYRCYVNRKKYRDGKMAAATIQKVFRGFKVRSEYTQKKNSIITIQRAFRNYRLATHHREQYLLFTTAIIQMQSIIRMKRQQSLYADEVKATGATQAHVQEWLEKKHEVQQEAALDEPDAIVPQLQQEAALGDSCALDEPDAIVPLDVDDVESAPTVVDVKAKEKMEKEAKRASLMASLAAKYGTASEDEKPIDPTLILKGSRAEILQNMRDRYLSSEGDEPAKRPEFVRKPRILQKNEAELPMEMSKFSRIQNVLNVSLAERFKNPKPPVYIREKDEAIQIDAKATPVIVTGLAPIEVCFDEPPKTMELLGSHNSRSRITLSSQRKRRPPTRKGVKELFETGDEVDNIKETKKPDKDSKVESSHGLNIVLNELHSKFQTIDSGTSGWYALILKPQHERLHIQNDDKTDDIPDHIDDMLTRNNDILGRIFDILDANLPDSKDQTTDKKNNVTENNNDLRVQKVEFSDQDDDLISIPGIVSDNSAHVTESKDLMTDCNDQIADNIDPLSDYIGSMSRHSDDMTDNNDDHTDNTAGCFGRFSSSIWTICETIQTTCRTLRTMCRVISVICRNIANLCCGHQQDLTVLFGQFVELYERYSGLYAKYAGLYGRYAGLY